MDDVDVKDLTPGQAPKSGDLAKTTSATAVIEPVTQTSGDRQGPPTIKSVGGSLNEDPNSNPGDEFRSSSEDDRKAALVQAEEILRQGK
jgi:hypothetical protein